MRTMTILAFLFLFNIGNAQKNVYESSKFDELSANHSTLAIIPFFTHLDLDEDFDRKELITLEEKEGHAVQDALETFFGRGKKRKKFSVELRPEISRNCWTNSSSFILR